MRSVVWFLSLSLAAVFAFAAAAAPVKFSAASWLSKWPVLLTIFTLVLLTSSYLVLKIRTSAASISKEEK